MARKQIHIYLDTLPTNTQEMIEFNIKVENCSLNRAVRKLISENVAGSNIGVLQEDIAHQRDIINELTNRSDKWENNYIKLSEKLADNASIDMDFSKIPMATNTARPLAAALSNGTVPYKGYEIKKLLAIKMPQFKDRYPEANKKLTNIKDDAEIRIIIAQTRIMDSHNIIMAQANNLEDSTIESVIEFLNSSNSVIFLEDIQAVLVAITKALHKFKDMLTQQNASIAPYKLKFDKFRELNEFFCEYVFTSTTFKYPWVVPVAPEDMNFKWEQVYRERYS